jgi:DNA-binding transcriptional LysR family regulator
LQSLEHVLSPGVFDAAQSDTTFVLAMADATAAVLMPGLIETIEREAQGISMRVLPLTTRDPRRLLAEGHVNLAVGHFPAVLADLTAQAQAGQAPSQQSAAFEHVRLYDGQYVCVMRKGHPLAKSRSLTLEDFCSAHHLLVSFSGRAFGFVDEALASLGRKRRIVLTVNQFFTAGRVVTRSNLLTVLPRDFVRVADSAGELVVRELPFAMPVVHVDGLWHHSNTEQAAHRWLREQIAKSATHAFLNKKGL